MKSVARRIAKLEQHHQKEKNSPGGTGNVERKNWRAEVGNG